MFCWNCGKELPDGQRFCGHCGADQSARPTEESGPANPFAGTGPAPQAPWGQPEPSQNQPAAPAGGPKTDLSILFKIFGIVCAIYFGYYALRGLLGIFTTAYHYIGWVLDYFNLRLLVSFVTSEVSSVIALALNLALCAVSAMIAFRRRPENADGLFLCFSGCALARMALIVLSSLLSMITGFVAGGVLGLLGHILLAAAAVGLLFGITVLAGEPMPLAGKSQAELKVSVAAAFNSAQSAAAEAGAKARDAAQTARENAAARAAQSAQAGPQAPQYGGQTPQYSQPAGYAGFGRLRTDRSLVLYILLSIITCGIYSWYFIYKMAQDVNTACAGDGNSTGGLVMFLLLSFVTCGIYPIFWWYGLANRLAANAPRYGMHFQENGTTVLLWYVFGALICGIGPYVAAYIVIKNTNAICMAYNQYNNL